MSRPLRLVASLMSETVWASSASLSRSDITRNSGAPGGPTTATVKGKKIALPPVIAANASSREAGSDQTTATAWRLTGRATVTVTAGKGVVGMTAGGAVGRDGIAPKWVVTSNLTRSLGTPPATTSTALAGE